jgi:ribosomal-protein-alanine N-acetyltransferase
MFDLGPSYVPLPPELADAKVRLRPPRFSDYRGWQGVREQSRAFLEPWEPVWESDMLTRAAYRKRVRLTVRDWRDDRGYGFHIFTTRDMPAAFQDFGLHRVEAACIPENTPSRALLDKFGFRQVGLARQYLRINGSWRDHVLHELQVDDLMSSRGMLGDAATRPRLVDRRA